MLRDPVSLLIKDKAKERRQSEREETFYLREGIDYGQCCPGLSEISEEFF